MLKNIKTKNIFVIIIFIYSLFCTLVISQGWDEIDNYLRGKITLDYIFSLGRIDEEIFLRESYSTFYWSTRYLISSIFPKDYIIETTHVVNFLISFSTLYGVKKIGKELFNDEVGNYSFLILFFIPFFLGHFGVNGKDTILAFCHVWIFVYLLKYIRIKNSYQQTNYFLKIGFLASIATGIQLVFIGSLFPIFFFFLLEIFYFQNNRRQIFYKKIFIDIFKSFLLFYFLLVLFWIDTYSNIIINPIKFLLNVYSEEYPTGWMYNLSLGKFYLADNVRWTYIFENLLLKLPEFIILLFIIFFVILFRSYYFFEKKFHYFSRKIVLIFVVILYPTLLLVFIPFPIYDGMRLFLWFVPYISIFPALSIFYLKSKINFKTSKFFLIILIPLFIFFLKNFIMITPYHYSYLNSFSNLFKNKNLIFENDYWGLSLGELIKNANIDKNKNFSFTVCGLNYDNAKYYLKKNEIYKYDLVGEKKADFVILTNRTSLLNDKIVTCFEKFKGINISEVKRNNITLSAIRKNIFKVTD